MDETDKIRRSALERKYLSFFALGEVVREVCRLRERDEVEFLRSFSKPKWQDEKSKSRFVDEAFNLACDIVVQVYQAAKEHGPFFVHRNFFRDQDTLAQIRNARASRRSQLKNLADDGR